MKINKDTVKVLMLGPPDVCRRIAALAAEDAKQSRFLSEIKKALGASEEDMEALKNKIVSLPAPNSYTLESLHGYVMRGDVDLNKA